MAGVHDPCDTPGMIDPYDLPGHEVAIIRKPAGRLISQPGLLLQVDAATATVSQCPHQDRCQHPSATDLGHRRLAILASVGEIDPLGTRRDGLDAFLDRKLEEGYEIEARTNTHAIIFRRPKGFKRFTSGADPGRYVVEVDEDGIATMRPAEPRRT